MQFASLAYRAMDAPGCSPASQISPNRGENLCITLGGTEIVKIEESANAEGAKQRLPKARSPSRLGGLGERRKPQKPKRF